MIVDTHAHLNFTAFDKDRDEIIKRCLDNNIWMINVGTNYETSKKAVEIAGKYPQGVYAAVGLHPINLETNLVKQKFDENEGGRFEEEFDFEKYKELALSSKKVVAIGEIGLDYYYKPKTKTKLALFKEKQKTLLEQELKLAKELNLPVIFHCRMAHQDLIEFLSENSQIKPKRAVAHGFVGNIGELQKYLDFDYYIGLNGIIFKTIEGIDFEKNIKKTPLDKILIETDCPFLTPPNFYPEQSRRIGEKRNNPLGVKFVAEHIAKIKNISFEKIAEITTKNTKDLFKI